MPFFFYDFHDCLQEIASGFQVCQISKMLTGRGAASISPQVFAIREFCVMFNLIWYVENSEYLKPGFHMFATIEKITMISLRSTLSNDRSNHMETANGTVVQIFLAFLELRKCLGNI